MASTDQKLVDREAIKVVIRTRPTPDFAGKNIAIDQQTQVSTHPRYKPRHS